MDRVRRGFWRRPDGDWRSYGIGKLAGCALESMARQPEVAGSIQTAMIIAAALIEGFTFYALFICSSR